MSASSVLEFQVDTTRPGLFKIVSWQNSVPMFGKQAFSQMSYLPSPFPRLFIDSQD